MVFLVMGVLLIRKPAGPIDADSRMTRPGVWAGFAVGVAAMINNPKAILFTMGVLPGFFDLSRGERQGYRSHSGDFDFGADDRQPLPRAFPRPGAAAAVQPESLRRLSRFPVVF